MKCNEIREMLPDLAAGLTAAGSDVNTHLRSCAGCAATFDELRKTMALLDEWQAPEPSPYFDTRVQARLREEAEKQRSPGWFAWLRRPALAVSLGVILVGGVSAYWVEQYRRPAAPVVVGSAVGDLQVLDNNHDMLSDSDPDSAASLLDDLQVQQDVNANP